MIYDLRFMQYLLDIFECRQNIRTILPYGYGMLEMSCRGVYGQKVMSLEECRLLALENNKKLKMADEQINAAKAKKEEAFTKYLPALDAMGTYMRNQKEINLLSEDAHLPVGTIGQDGKWTLGKDQIMIGADGKPVMNNGQYVPKDYALLPKEAMTVDDRNMALLQVGLTQPIYMGGKIRAYNQLAGLSEKLAESGREQELQNIIQETDEAYWQIVSLVNRQKLAVKFVETLQKFEHDIEVMYRTAVWLYFKVSACSSYSEVIIGGSLCGDTKETVVVPRLTFLAAIPT